MRVSADGALTVVTLKISRITKSPFQVMRLGQLAALTKKFFRYITALKTGVHLKAVFTPLTIGSTEISRSRFKQYKNPLFITQINVLGCFVNFWVIFRYISEEIVFLKRVV